MPLTAPEARKLIRHLLDHGTTVVSPHARIEMTKDNLTDVDVVNVLRGGVVREPELEHGSWRYRVETPRIAVVCAFDPEPDEAEDKDAIELVVVTAWRVKP
jgi:hypothetical protein